MSVVGFSKNKFNTKRADKTPNHLFNNGSNLYSIIVINDDDTWSVIAVQWKQLDKAKST